MKVTRKVVRLMWYSSKGPVDVKYMPTDHVKNIMASLKARLKNGRDPMCGERTASTWLELFKGVIKHRHTCVNQFLKILPKANEALCVANQLHD